MLHFVFGMEASDAKFRSMIEQINTYLNGNTTLCIYDPKDGRPSLCSLATYLLSGTYFTRGIPSDPQVGVFEAAFGDGHRY